MNDRFDLHIITQPHSEVYCGYFRRLVFGNSLTFSHIPLCFHAKPPNFPRLFDPRALGLVGCKTLIENAARPMIILYIAKPRQARHLSRTKTEYCGPKRSIKNPIVL